MAYHRSLFKKLVALKIYALTTLGYVRSPAEPVTQTLTDQSRPLQRITAGPYSSITEDVLFFSKNLGLDVDTSGIRMISNAASFRVTSRSGTLATGLEKLACAARRAWPRMACSMDRCFNARRSTRGHGRSVA